MMLLPCFELPQLHLTIVMRQETSLQLQEILKRKTVGCQVCNQYNDVTKLKKTSL